MKKNVQIFVLFAAILSVSVHAEADLIYIPFNEFFMVHQEECTKVSNVYVAVVDTYYYSEPQGIKRGNIKAGESIFIGYTWQDDWGIGNAIWGDEWIRLKDFKRMYNETDFLKDHRAEFVEAGGIIHCNKEKPVFSWDVLPESVDCSIIEITETLKEGNYPIYLWTFPGSGNQCWTIEKKQRIETLSFEMLYLDSDGHLWSKVDSYPYKGWVCLSKTSDDTLPCTAPLFAEEHKPVSQIIS